MCFYQCVVLSIGAVHKDRASGNVLSDIQMADLLAFSFFFSFEPPKFKMTAQSFQHPYIFF